MGRPVGSATNPSATVLIANATMFASAGTLANASGGTIHINSQGQQQMFTGTISITGTTVITANGAGSGQGGDIQLAGAFSSGLLAGFPLFADGGSSGRGGTIGIANGSENLTLTGLAAVQARGGISSGRGGDVVIATPGKLTIGAAARVDVISQGNGNGGVVVLIAIPGGLLSPSGPQIQVSGQVTANGGPSGGTGGSITLKYSDSNGLASIQLDSAAIVRADSPSGAVGGMITLQNDGTAGLNATINGLLSANKGTLIFDKTGQPINVIGTLGSAGGPLVGKVTSHGSTVTFEVTSTNDLSLGEVTATVDATIQQHGNGSIKRQDGTITANNLVISADVGNIGTSSAPVLTAVTGLNANTSPAGEGAIYIINSKEPAAALTVQSGGSGGTYSLQSNYDIILQNLRSERGDISVTATDGVLTVFDNNTIRTILGTIKLQGTTRLRMGIFCTVWAQGGNLELSVGRAAVGSCLETDVLNPPVCRPANVAEVIVNGGKIYWGDGLVVPGGLGAIPVIANGREIVFDSNGAADKISIELTSQVRAQ